MNTLYGTTSMCCAYETRLAAVKMPRVPSRPLATGPQYFTFDPLPEVTKSPANGKPSKTSRIKKRSRRVLYPPVVKRYYPTEERSYAKRLLFILLTIIFFQVYNAEEDLPLMVAFSGTEENISHCSLEEIREYRCEPVFLEQPVSTTLSLASMEETNGTSWHWEEEEASQSAVDITQFLEQSLAAF